jgi:hypothetical protein
MNVKYSAMEDVLKFATTLMALFNASVKWVTLWHLIL